MSTQGSLLKLWRYPVKSMGGEALSSARVSELGLVGDRLWALRDEESGLITDGKKIPKIMLCSARYLREPDGSEGETSPPIVITLGNGEQVHSDEGDVHEKVSDYCGRPLRLVARTQQEHFFDVHTLHLLATPTLAAFQEALPSSDFAASRFRPNLLVDTPELAAAEEQTWCGNLAEVGSLRMRMEMPTERCSMVMRAHGDLPDDPAVLRAVVEDGNFVGVYGTVEQAGVIEIGQALTLVDID